MSNSKDGIERNKYQCWINEKKKILSFHFVDGYQLKEFDTHKEFQDFYYQKSYWGYRVQ